MFWDTYIGLCPCPVTVTTRIITCLVGDPNLNLHLPLASWRGDNPTSRWLLMSSDVFVSQPEAISVSLVISFSTVFTIQPFGLRVCPEVLCFLRIRPRKLTAGYPKWRHIWSRRYILKTHHFWYQFVRFRGGNISVIGGKSSTGLSNLLVIWLAEKTSRISLAHHHHRPQGNRLDHKIMGIWPLVAKPQWLGRRNRPKKRYLIFSTCIARIMSHGIYKRDRAFSTSPVFFSENILAQVPDIQLVKHGREIREGTVHGFVSVVWGNIPKHRYMSRVYSPTISLLLIGW